MKKILLLLIFTLTFTSYSQNRKAVNFIRATSSQPIAGEVYVNTFEDTSGLILNESVGTVTSEPIIGTRTPEVNKALTLEHNTNGSVTAAIPLPPGHDVLYFQYYTTVLNKSTASNYANNAEIGQAIQSLEAAHMYMRHNSPNNEYSIFGQSAGGFLDTTYDSALAVWYKVGIKVDKIALTVSVYINNNLVDTIAAQNRDLNYITLGGTGNGSSNYKVQYAALSVNSLGFQDIITNSNRVGENTEHFVDYSILQHPDYLPEWTGLHAYAIDIDGDGVADDGPSPYLYEIATSNSFVKPGDHCNYKSGEEHYISSLSKSNIFSIGTDANYNETDYITISSYGSVLEPMPIVNSSMIANSADWEVFDPIDDIYRIPVTAAQNATGAWQTGEDKAMRQVFDLSNMQLYSGSWYKTTTHFYIRLWDDTDPSLQEIAIGTNQTPSFRPYTQIRNIHWRHANINVSKKSLVENCDFSKSSGGSVSDATFRNNRLYDLWSGTDYGNTETNNAGFGTAGSGDGGGIKLNENALVYGCTIEDAYLAVTIDSEAHNAVFAYSMIKNTVVNSITISGNGNGNPQRRVLIANITVFGGSRHKNNDPYPLTRPQPGHTVVHQNGGFGAFTIVNCLFMHHYNQNDEFPNQNVNSSNNVMSFVANSLVGASGRMGYNKYFITPESNSPAVLFNTGGNNINTWGVNMAAAGDFRDLDGESNPDTTSSVAGVLPVVQADYTTSSGKWLATNPIPTVTGGGLDLSAFYATKGIYTDLSGNPITSTMNIGAY